MDLRIKEGHDVSSCAAVVPHPHVTRTLDAVSALQHHSVLAKAKVTSEVEFSDVSSRCVWFIAQSAGAQDAAE